MNEVLRTILLFVISMLAFKSMLGFHFPWEKCECCGKKWRDHPEWKDQWKNHSQKP